MAMIMVKKSHNRYNNAGQVGNGWVSFGSQHDMNGTLFENSGWTQVICVFGVEVSQRQNQLIYVY